MARKPAWERLCLKVKKRPAHKPLKPRAHAAHDKRKAGLGFRDSRLAEGASV